MADEPTPAERLAQRAAEFEAAKAARDATRQAASQAQAISERQDTLRREREAREAGAKRARFPFTGRPREERQAREPRATRVSFGKRLSRAGGGLGRALARGRRLRGSEPGGFEVRSKQVLAALLLPFLFVAGMGITTALFQSVMAILSGVGLSNHVITTMIQILVGTGLFVGLIYAAFKWVKSGGLGLFG